MDRSFGHDSVMHFTDPLSNIREASARAVRNLSSLLAVFASRLAKAHTPLDVCTVPCQPISHITSQGVIVSFDFAAAENTMGSIWTALKGFAINALQMGCADQRAS